MKQPPGLSSTLVDKAGTTLRDDILRRDVDPDQVRQALDVVTRFRATWAAPPQPLAKASMGLRSMTRRVVESRARSSQARVSQRLKRLHRIVEKLSRPEHRTMRLSQMEDIGGCRAVVPTLPDLQRLRERVHDAWHAQVRVEKDYIVQPKPDGYRAIHVVVLRDGRLIEIQLRTQLQHLWAAHVERLEMTRSEVLRRGLAEAQAGVTLSEMAEVFARWDTLKGISVEAVLGMLTGWLAQLDKRR